MLLTVLWSNPSKWPPTTLSTALQNFNQFFFIWLISHYFHHFHHLLSKYLVWSSPASLRIAKTIELVLTNSTQADLEIFHHMSCLFSFSSNMVLTISQQPKRLKLPNLLLGCAEYRYTNVLHNMFNYMTNWYMAIWYKVAVPSQRSLPQNQIGVCLSCKDWEIAWLKEERRNDWKFLYCWKSEYMQYEVWCHIFSLDERTQTKWYTSPHLTWVVCLWRGNRTGILNSGN